MVWAEFVHFTARPVKGVPDPHLHAHCYVFNATWDETEKQWKAGQFRDLKADAPYFEAAFHARFARKLADIGYKIERTAKGWELAGVPERVLHEFSKRSEQVEQKAKELGVTTAKEKDGLAALTRERKQKQLSKAELRELWEQRVSPAERLPFKRRLQTVFHCAANFGTQRRWILRFSIATSGPPSPRTRNCCVRRFAMVSAMWTWNRSSANCCGMILSKNRPMDGNGSQRRKCCQRKSG
jgi:hypothetical protein